MKKIISLFIVFLVYLYPSISHAKEMNTAFFSFSNQEQTNSIFNQSAIPIDLIDKDLLELTEDEISHFDRKPLTAIKIVFNGHDNALELSTLALLQRKRLPYFFINPFSFSQSFLGNYRI